MYLPTLCLSVRIIAKTMLVLSIVHISSLFMCYWPVHKVEVQVVELQVLESELTS